MTAMGTGAAVRTAIDLIHVPARVRTARLQPLPGDVAILLRIASGDEDELKNASEATGRPASEIINAAGFYIEQVLLSPESHAYRILGSTETAPSAELRRNMALLMQWLHPDKTQDGDRSIFATRIASAWESVKTPERRAAYDRARQDLSMRRERKRSRSSPRRSQDAKGSTPHAGRQTGLLDALRALLWRGRD